MRVGVYVDGFNLYYSGRRWFGRGAPGWRWLSPKALAATLVEQRRNWTEARVDRVVYCTARVDASDDPTAYIDQDVYLKALAGAGVVDHIEFGRYVARAKPVLISNDSDLSLPVKIVRQRVPLGVINPSPGRMAGALQGAAGEGVGRHWWRQLQPSDFTSHQLPSPVAGFTRPPEW